MAPVSCMYFVYTAHSVPMQRSPTLAGPPLGLPGASRSSIAILRTRRSTEGCCTQGWLNTPPALPLAPSSGTVTATMPRRLPTDPALVTVSVAERPCSREEISRSILRPAEGVGGKDGRVAGGRAGPRQGA